MIQNFLALDLLLSYCWLCWNKQTDGKLAGELKLYSKTGSRNATCVKKAEGEKDNLKVVVSFFTTDKSLNFLRGICGIKETR